MPEPVTRRVVVATRNPGKLAEIRAALAFPGWEFVTAQDIGRLLDVDETGDTFLENALLKAEAYHHAFGLPALADDSGLEVDALDGAPGIRSSRFSGQDATDARNNERLLRELEGVPPERRMARFRSVIVFMDADGSVTTAEGTCEGRIADEGRGEGGFGYDPLFLPDAVFGRTMAELGMDEKNAVSHRGAALRELRRRLAEREEGS